MNRQYSAVLVRELPSFTDLLLVGVEAGWTFDQTMGYLINNHPSPLAGQFQPAYTAISAGRPREEALRDLSARCQVPQLARLIDSVLIIEKSGGALVPMLKMQAEDLRRAQRQRTERKVKQTPLKMTLVTAVFIFPAVLCTLMAPAAVTVLSNLFHVS